ncbi:phosphopyruvate hydratase [Methylobacterium sp. C25]|uniref:phosphopyruvate hydratase n=1 Tax=Methylobacterium sp. C25 TaxID=2721622 RepID=UPI001F22482C|nr:phosphopyruvate hydratase [Methylobacterium sp. C25]MCE4224970.1 phosphopyruvate hydratase [Methylobacterium sp. C25]
MTSVSRIQRLEALEIIDSRGHPTLQVTVSLSDGTTATAAVPSGASTGLHEAAELRDGDRARYGGRGVRKAVASVEKDIAATLKGRDVHDQVGIDEHMIALDGTANKSRLGANSLLGTSMAVAQAAAASDGRSLYAHLGGEAATLLPMPFMNVLNGGKHADSSLDFQEFMLVPLGAPSFAEAMRYGVEVYAALRELLRARSLSTAVGDEGGFAPRLESNEAACAIIVAAIERAGYHPGRDVAIALDPAASSFATAAGYDLSRSGTGILDREALLALYGRWIDTWPIVSIEDGFAEDDWTAFQAQTAAHGARLQIVGDDLLVTNPTFIERAIVQRAGNAALIKPNQIGTVTETARSIRLCQEAGWGTMVSHRSGETTDTFIADLAVGLGCGQIKSGAPCRGERLAKYNRLLAIEAELGSRARFANPFA